MTRLPRLTGREVIDTLAKGGFKVVRIKGSHHLSATMMAEPRLCLFMVVK